MRVRIDWKSESLAGKMNAMRPCLACLLGLALATGCSRENPLFGVGVSAGDEQVGGTLASDGASATSRGESGNDSGLTGSFSGTSAGASDSTGGLGADSGMSTDSGTSVGETERMPNPIEPPCAGVVDDPNLLACWDFDDVEGTVVYDRTGKGHDLVFEAPVVQSPSGAWGAALDAAPSQAGVASGFSVTEGLGVEIWFRVDDPGAWDVANVMLSIRDSTRAVVGGIGFETYMASRAVFLSGVGPELVLSVEGMGDSLCAAARYRTEGAITTATFNAFGPDSFTGAPDFMTEFPNVGQPFSIGLSSEWGGVIDGIRVWSTDEFPSCDPRPPP